MCQACMSLVNPRIGEVDIIFVLSRSDTAHNEQVRFLKYVIQKQLKLGKDDYGIVTIPSQIPKTQCWSKNLASKIQHSRPKVVVTLGSIPYQSLGGFGSITDQRSKVFTHPVIDCPILPTVSPAYVLRSPSTIDQFSQELFSALLIRDGHNHYISECKPVNYHVLGDEEDIYHSFSYLYKQADIKDIVVDIETGGGDGANSYKGGYILAIGLAYGPDDSFIIPFHLLDSEIVKNRLRDLFTSDFNFIYHNGKFDVQYLRQYLGTDAIQCSDDTMLIHYALHEERGIHGLKDLSRSYLGAGNYEEGLEKYVRTKGKETDEFGDEAEVKFGEHDYARIPSDVLHRYLAHDVCYTYRLYDILKPQLEEKDKLGLYENILMPIQAVLIDVEQVGLEIDPIFAHNKANEYRHKVNNLKTRLQRMAASELGWSKPLELGKKGQLLKRKEGYYEFNPSSPKQVQEILYDRLKLTSPDPRKSRGTDRKVLSALAKTSNHPFVEDLLEYRTLAKILGTYLEGVAQSADQNNRVHGNYNVHGTTTGRLSSSNPNMQNIPRSSRPEGKDVKNLFVPKDGYIFVQADYSQAEYRTAGILSGDQFLWETYKSGGDLHNSMAVGLYGKDFNKEQRTKAKTTNFGAMYGAGAKTLSETLGIPRWEASEILQNYWLLLQTLQQQIIDWQTEARQTGSLRTPFGRTRTWNFYDFDRGYDGLEKEAGNFPIQSVASDFMLLSLIEIHAILKKTGWGRIVATVHDSVLMEVLPQHVDAVVEMSRLILSSAPKKHLNSDFPFKADFEKGNRWGDMKDYG